MFGEIGIVLQLALGIVFLLSAAGKVRDPKGFAQGVVNYQFMPPSFASAVALMIVGVESLLAIAHLTGWLLAVAVPLGFATLVTFAVAVGVNLRRGRMLPCYCFGSRGGETISRRTLARLVMLLSAEALLLADASLFTRIELIFPNRIASFQELALAVFWATFLLVVGSWVLSLGDFMDLLRSTDTRPARMGAARGPIGPTLGERTPSTIESQLDGPGSPF